MENNKVTMTEKLKRIAALQYNPFLEQEAKRLRNIYGVPTDIEIAIDWYYKEHASVYGREILGATYTTKKSSTESIRQEGGTIYDSEDQLEQAVLRILEDFRLPPRMFSHVLTYILIDNAQVAFCHVWSEPILSLKFEKCRGEFEFTATIQNVNLHTSKKVWLAIYDAMITGMKKSEQKMLERCSLCENIEYCANALGIFGTSFSKKRSTLASYETQMRRWAEWYQLVEIEGLPIGDALDKWLQSHPEQDSRKGIDESTVSKAVGEFRKIITPITIQD